jgi:enoyl-CoA hydratase/carnithine racemase
VTMDLHGGCIGAGIELAAFAGLVRATPDTLISLPEVQMGLIPGAGGTVSITRRVGRHRCAYLALSGCAISAQTALEWGLVDEWSTGY